VDSGHERRGRGNVEFLGYSDKFIRYRLMSGIMLACTRDKYEGRESSILTLTEENNMPKFFNTSGPCDPEKHYVIDMGDDLKNVRRRGTMA